jgi:DNA primase
MLSKIIDSCRFLLENFPEAQNAREYLNSRLNTESRETFQFGFFPRINELKVLTDMIGEDALLQAELLYYREIEDSLCLRRIPVSYFEDYPVVMPFRNIYGEVVAIIGRTLLNETEMKLKGISKYKNTRSSKQFEKGHLVYGLYENKQNILDQNCVYVVEGQFDVIKAVEKGLRNVVALGTSNMSPYQFSVITRYTDNIFLLLDNDNAGEKGRKLAINRFGKLANIQNFYLPESYKDIDEYLTNSGDESVSFVVKA